MTALAITCQQCHLPILGSTFVWMNKVPYHPACTACTCPPADKGHAFGKITAGCPIHAQPVDGALFNLPDGGGEI